MPFLLACLAYLGVALPGSTLGILWPSIRTSLHQPIGALGILLFLGVTASALASAATGHALSRVRVGLLVACGTLLVAAALAEESLAPSLLLFGLGVVLFGLGFGALDGALNAYAAGHFGARQITWMHASYGLGATIGPLLVTVLLRAGLGWRGSFAVLAAVCAALGLTLAVARRGWDGAPRPPSSAPGTGPRRRAIAAGALAFCALETGIESGAGVWGYVFLTDARGLSATAAGVALSAYWATMFLGRVTLGPLAERVGEARVLGAAVAGVLLGAGLLAAPAAWLAVAGLLLVGLAAAPIFPLFTLSTARRSGVADVDRSVGLQVAASAAGSAALPAGIGVAIGALGAGALAPALLVLGLALGGVHRLLAEPA